MESTTGKNKNVPSLAWPSARLLAGIPVVLLILGQLFLVTAAAEARIVKGDTEAAPLDPLPVFEALASAWQQGDQQAVAALVHESGLNVTTGGNAARSTHYSPSQAFYYFKNMFQTHRTLVFTFAKTQAASAGDRVHGMAEWKRRRPDSERIQELKLVCVLARQGDQWRLVEINKIR
jgi:ketosteroid isomerase-like protein